MWNTEQVEEQTTWDGLWENAAEYEGKLSIFDSPDFIADAALHLMATQPDLGIKNPYQLTQEQFDAAIALLEEARQPRGAVLVRNDVRRADHGLAAGDVTIGTTWQYMVNSLVAEEAPVQAIKPARGRRDGPTPG